MTHVEFYEKTKDWEEKFFALLNVIAGCSSIEEMELTVEAVGISVPDENEYIGLASGESRRKESVGAVVSRCSTVLIWSLTSLNGSTLPMRTLKSPENVIRYLAKPGRTPAIAKDVCFAVKAEIGKLLNSPLGSLNAVSSGLANVLKRVDEMLADISAV